MNPRPIQKSTQTGVAQHRNTSELDTSELADRLKNRDPEAMAELYDRYGVLVYSIVRRMIWDSANAEDVVQEVFLRIWNGTHLLDRSRGIPLGWLHTVARNCAIDTLRSTRGKAFCTISEIPDGLVRNGEVFHLNRLLIERALQDLNADQRRLIEMVYFEGLSQIEIAAKLDRPLGTVKTWVRGALVALRASTSADGSAQVGLASGSPRFGP